MKKWMFLIVILGGALLFVSPINAQEIGSPTKEVEVKTQKIEQSTPKWEKDWQQVTAKMIQGLGIKWSKQYGVQLFKWGSGMAAIKGGKLVYSRSEKPNEEITLDYHGSDNEVVMGYSHKF